MTTEIIILHLPPLPRFPFSSFLVDFGRVIPFFFLSFFLPFFELASFSIMGLFASFLDAFCEHCSSQSIYTLAVVGSLSFIALSVVVNVLRQLLFKNPHEPPVVFHWFPFVGSTISYGMEPYKFFNTSRAKVCLPLSRSSREHFSKRQTERYLSKYPHGTPQRKDH